jgi:hypothetical protein
MKSRQIVQRRHDEMKLSLGIHLRPSPWGGANQFGGALVGYLKKKGAEASFDLSAPDIVVSLADAKAHREKWTRRAFAALGKPGQSGGPVRRNPFVGSK